MKQVATLKLKLLLSKEEEARLQATQQAYVRALNHTSQLAFRTGVHKPTDLHHLCYHEVRSLTGLSANLTCSARSVVCEQYKREPSPKKPHHFREDAAVRYDERTLSFDLTTASATLNTLKKNQRVSATLVISEYHQRFLAGSWSFARTATLTLRKGRYYLHLLAQREVQESTAEGVLSSDAGLRRVATTSTGKVFKGGRISHIRRENFEQRRYLQAGHKSRGERRLLQRLAGREHRAVEWLLWNIANEIVREALRTGCGTIVLEELKYILRRIRAARRQRLILYGWPFASLAAKVKQVAARYGIRVVEIDPAYSSQECRCGHIARKNRVSQSLFVCQKCGYSHNADLVAAHNLRRRYVAAGGGAVNRPSMPASHEAGQSLLL
jgi:IS605 OrfB family transposase